MFIHCSASALVAPVGQSPTLLIGLFETLIFYLDFSSSLKHCLFFVKDNIVKHHIKELSRRPHIHRAVKSLTRAQTALRWKNGGWHQGQRWQMGDLACRQPAGGPSISPSSACWSGGGAGGQRLGNRERRIATHSKARLPHMTVCLLAPFFLQSSRRLSLLFAFSHSCLIFRGETLRARSVVALCITPAWFSFSWVFSETVTKC